MPARADTVSLTTILAAVLHEMKNSLGQVTLLLGQVTQVDQVSTAQSACHRMASRITQALLLYRAGESTLDLNIDAHDPVDLVEDLAREAGILAGGKLVLQTRLTDAPCCVFLDCYLVEMVLLDAIRNALDHARETVCLSVETSDDGSVAFFVDDDGCGYPPHIFLREPLTFAGSLRSTGLGLHFADAVAAAHSIEGGTQGRVHLGVSQMGGARFVLVLP